MRRLIYIAIALGTLLSFSASVQAKKTIVTGQGHGSDCGSATAEAVRGLQIACSTNGVLEDFSNPPCLEDKSNTNFTLTGECVTTDSAQYQSSVLSGYGNCDVAGNVPPKIMGCDDIHKYRVLSCGAGLGLVKVQCVYKNPFSKKQTATSLKNSSDAKDFNGAVKGFGAASESSKAKIFQGGSKAPISEKTGGSDLVETPAANTAN